MTVVKIRGPAHTRANKAREKFAREYGSTERVGWVKSLPCCCCGRTPSENAHTANGGMGRKAGYATIAPLCTMHHQTIHQHGMTAIEMLYGVDLKNCAAWTEMEWLKHQPEATHAR